MSQWFDDLMEGLNAYKDFTQGKIPLRTKTLEKSKPAYAYISAEEVKAIRKPLNLSPGRKQIKSAVNLLAFSFHAIDNFQ